VDNTGGEDWTNVQMSLVAGAPQAFIQQISRPYYVQRPVVPLPDRFLLTPQTHAGAVTVSAPAPPAPAASPAAAPKFVAALPNSQRNVTIDGVASRTSSPPSRLDAISEAVLVSSVSQARFNQLSDADAEALGDLFEYKMKEPITIRRGQSALVPILSSEITAEKVSLWNADSDSRRAVRAFWLTNTTGMTLDGGSFSVVEGQAFAGEGLMDPIKAGEKRLLSYAVDLGLTLDASDEDKQTRMTTVKVVNGTLVAESEEGRRSTY